MKNQTQTRTPNNVTNPYSGKIHAPTVTVDRFEQQVAYILSILGEFNESFKYAMITDSCTFRGMRITKKQLKYVSKELGINVESESKLSQVAEEMFRQNIEYHPRD